MLWRSSISDPNAEPALHKRNECFIGSHSIHAGAKKQGAMGSLACAKQFPATVAGIVLPGPSEIYLAHGERDRYARASHLLAAALPSNHVLTDKQGDHDWSTWLKLWRRFLTCCGHQLERGNQYQPPLPARAPRRYDSAI